MYAAERRSGKREEGEVGKNLRKTFDVKHGGSRGSSSSSGGKKEISWKLIKEFLWGQKRPSWHVTSAFIGAWSASRTEVFPENQHKGGPEEGRRPGRRFTSAIGETSNTAHYGCKSLKKKERARLRGGGGKGITLRQKKRNYGRGTGGKK